MHGLPLSDAPATGRYLKKDSAVGYVMERVDLVLVGAEAIVESGGVVNSIGTYQLGIVAKATGTPFYVGGLPKA